MPPPPQSFRLRLSAEKLGIERGGRTLLTNLTLSVGPGEALIVTGPNGAGKSSLLRVLAGLLRPSDGSIRLEGLSDDDDPAPGAHAHYVGHADAQKPALTARENLQFWAAMLSQSRTGATPEAALARFSIRHTADFQTGYLSAGQKRRLALARLLTAPRPIWILDEPATALDAATQESFADIMREHLSAGGVIVAATHAPLGLAGARELRLGSTP